MALYSLLNKDEGLRGLSLGCLSEPDEPENESEPVSDNSLPLCFNIRGKLFVFAPVINESLDPDLGPVSCQIFKVSLALKILAESHKITESDWIDIHSNFLINHSYSILVLILKHVI